MQRLRTWLATIPLSDPLQRQQAAVFQGLLIGWIMLASIGVPGLFLMPAADNAAPLPPEFLIILLILSIAACLLWISPVVALVLLRRGKFSLSVGATLVGFLLSHSLATFIMGSSDAAILVLFQLPIVLAGLLTNRRVLIAVTGYILTLVIVVAILQSMTPPLAGHMTMLTSPNGAAINQPALGLGIGFFTSVTILVAVLLDRFGNALRSALNTSRERETELQHIRAALESTVAERTAALQQALSEVQAKAQQQEQLLAELNEQRELIKDLSVPVIPLDDKTLVMPLIGALDTIRLQQLQTQCLQALERTGAQTLLLDITGVPVIDTQVAQGIVMTVQAGRLLGADVALVGIRPEVAQTIVGLGIRLQEVHTFSSLQAALMQRKPSKLQMVST